MTDQIADPAHADRTEWAEANQSGGWATTEEALTPEALAEEALRHDERESRDMVAWCMVNGLDEMQARQALANYIKAGMPEDRRPRGGATNPAPPALDRKPGIW